MRRHAPRSIVLVAGAVLVTALATPISALSPTSAGAAEPDELSVDPATALNTTATAVTVTADGAGYDQTFDAAYALRSDGSAWSWATPYGGFEGPGQPTELPHRVTMTGDLAGATIASVDRGYDHIVGLTTDGRAIGWGADNTGAINAAVPVGYTYVPVVNAMNGALEGRRLVQVEAGDDWSMGLDDGGGVFTWGANPDGVRGVGDRDDHLQPTEVLPSNPIFGPRVVKIAAGVRTALALLSDGTVVSWGGNFTRMLGWADESVERSTVPIGIPPSVFDGQRIVDIAAADQHVLALAEDGTLYAWGVDPATVGSATPTRTAPIEVPLTGALADAEVAAIFAGGAQSAIITTDGRLATWGYGDYGSLGDGTTESRSVPAPITATGALADGVLDVSLEISRTVAVAADGSLYEWGAMLDEDSQDGWTAATTPQPVAMPTLAVSFGNEPPAAATRTSSTTASVDTPETDAFGPVDVDLTITEPTGEQRTVTASDGFEFGAKPTVWQQPTGGSVSAPTTVQFVAEGEGWPRPSPHWQRRGADGEWRDVGSGDIEYGAGSRSTTMLSVEVDGWSDVADYRATFINDWSEVTTQTASVGITPSLAIDAQPENQTALVDETAVFEAEFHGFPEPGVQWQQLVDGDWIDLDGETGAALEVVASAALQGAQYRVVVTTGPLVQQSDAATLTVEGASVSGTLVARGGNALPPEIAQQQVVIAKRDAGGSWVDRQLLEVAADGTFDITTLPAGTYKLSYAELEGVLGAPDAVLHHTRDRAPITVAVDAGAAQSVEFRSSMNGRGQVSPIVKSIVPASEPAFGAGVDVNVAVSDAHWTAGGDVRVEIAGIERPLRATADATGVATVRIPKSTMNALERDDRDVLKVRATYLGSDRAESSSRRSEKFAL